MESNDVIQLDSFDHIRLRPGMYIGETTDASVILREAIDNSVDELYARGGTKSDTIWIENIQDTSYLVADNGRGIPIKESPQREGWTMTKLAVSLVNAGSKFNKTQLAIGTNGVGISCTNATSSKFLVMSRLKLHDLTQLPKWLYDTLPTKIKGNTYYYCEFERGVLTGEGFREYDTTRFGQNPSTITIFSPDPEIFESTRAKLPTSLPYVKYILARLGTKAHIYCNGEEYLDSVTSLGLDIDVTIKSHERHPKNDQVRLLISVGVQDRLDPCSIQGSVNGLACDTGLHVRWVQNSFCRAFSEVYTDCHRYELQGMSFLVIALCNEPAFASQTKERLADIDGFTSSGEYEVSTLAEEFKKLFRKNKDLFKEHELKILEYMRSTEKIGRKEFLKASLNIAANNPRAEAMTPKKLRDCSTTNRRSAELFICEGDSAAGSLINARNPEIHAILGLRGKPLNTTGLEIEEVLSNQEMNDLISSIGVGVNEYHDMSEVRYGKVIIVADADPDGKNIDALCLGALATHLTFLVEAGCVYVANTPLYVQGGKYYLDDKDLDKTKSFSRFKGLGECNPEDLAPFVFDPNVRRLTRITMDNWEEAKDMLTSAKAKRRIMMDHDIIREEPLSF